MGNVLQLSTELRAKEQEEQQNVMSCHLVIFRLTFSFSFRHATIAELRDELEVLRGRYKKCNDVERDLRTAYDKLELRLKDAVPQGNTEDDIDDVCTPSTENHLSMNTSPMQRNIYMAKFPAVSMRPRWQKLQICLSYTKCDFELKISPDIKSKWSLDRVFFFHDRAMWSLSTR
ncbi:hypothetical protein PILCRDRAFT_817366 [Piloderma croceum F 1598]|uniref:Uncharacterized protein n=1 Tax=Piloderma croceum (strain F 1598) TaxID=765440 RepID=A0A0C3G013_PILCF|nr:hypothetical protein PILCRDRAFT_817366 [Piloderma croceum F 1598]